MPIRVRMTVTRYDAARLGNVKKTSQGFLRAPARVTRTGVLTYHRADGTAVRELRRPENVFAADSLATLADAPVTDLHPRDMLSPSNAKQLAVGHVSGASARADAGKFVEAQLVITDAAMIAAIEAGDRSEVSCGYTCDLVHGAGVFQGEHYDAEQTNIVYNHLGLGPRNWGRAGAEVALRLDSKTPDDFALGDGAARAVLAAPADDATAPDPTDDELETVLGERDALRAHVAMLEQKLEDAGDQAAAIAQADALRAQADALRIQLAKSKMDASDRFDEHVHARAELLAQARRVLDDDDYQQFDRTWSERRIQERVLERFQHRLDERRLDVSRESNEFVRSRYEAVVARLAADAKRARHSTPIVAQQHHDADDVHGLLSGRVHIEQPPRVYQTPPWRMPLQSSNPRR